MHQRVTRGIKCVEICVTSFMDDLLPLSVMNDKRLDFLRNDVRVIAGDDEQIVVVDGDEYRAESETFKIMKILEKIIGMMAILRSMALLNLTSLA